MANTSSRLRVGVVGINNRIRRVILKGLSESPRAVVTAVCSRSAEKATAVAEELGTAAPYTDYERMLREAPIDAVVIETPPELHHPMALAALVAGKHVCCEKPLACSAAQARELEQAARKAGLRTAVNFTYRSMAVQRFFARLLVGGEIGELLHFSLGYWQARQLFPDTPKKGAIDDIGPHALDALRWWSGAAAAGTSGAVGAGEVAAVASLESGAGETFPPSQAPIWQAIVRLTGGATGTIQASRLAVGFGNGITATFHGRQGALALAFDVDQGSIQRARLGQGRPEGRWQPVEIPADLIVSYEAFPRFHLDRIAGALLGQETDFPDFADGLRVQEIQEAATIASAEERWVTLPPR